MEIQWGVLIALASVIVSYLAFSLNKTKETKTESKQEAQIQAELGYIRRGVDDIKIDIKANERQLIALGERVTRVEESNKSLHKRVDNMEKERVQ